MIMLLESWHRVLLGGVLGMVGVAVFFVVRLVQETTKREARSWWLGTFIVAGAGMVLVGVADWILRPVTVPTWLRWTIIGMAGALGITSFIGLQRARSKDEVALMVVLYFVALFFAFLTIRLVFWEYIDWSPKNKYEKLLFAIRNWHLLDEWFVCDRCAGAAV